jgi:hypothetical protein
MNPATGTFTSMDTYGGSVFDPTSLHKYLYANANPVSNTDPSGYFSLGEVVSCQSIMQVLSKSWSVIVLNAIKGAIAGAVLGAVDSILGGNSITQVFKGALKGALWGAALGALITTLACLGAVYAWAIFALQVCRGIFVVLGLFGAYVSAKEGHPLQAVFRALLALYSFKKMGKLIDDVKLYHAKHVEFVKQNIGPDFKPYGPKVQEGVNPNS